MDKPSLKLSCVVIGAIVVAVLIGYGVKEKAGSAHRSAAVASERLEAQNSEAGKRGENRKQDVPAPSDDALAGVPLQDVKALIRLKLTQWGQTKTEDESSRERLLETMKSMLTDENAAELTRMLSDDELSSPFGLIAYARWLKVDPREAAQWMSTQAGATDLQARLIARQLLTDEKALQGYCNNLPDTAWKQTVLGESSLIAVEKNPALAARLAQQMKPGKEQTNALETVVYDWATRDLAGAMSLVGSISDSELREKTMVMTAKAIAMGDPDLGAQWLASAVKSDGPLREAAQSLVEIWAQHSPAEAARWLSHATDVSVRASAVDVLARAWMKSDPTAAQAWITTLPERDRVETMLKEEQTERDRPKD